MSDIIKSAIPDDEDWYAASRTPPTDALRAALLDLHEAALEMWDGITSHGQAIRKAEAALAATPPSDPNHPEHYGFPTWPGINDFDDPPAPPSAHPATVTPADDWRVSTTHGREVGPAAEGLDVETRRILERARPYLVDARNFDLVALIDARLSSPEGQEQ